MPVSTNRVGSNCFRVGTNVMRADEWTPLDIGADLVAWYDANDASTVTESSGNVSQWDDKSGNGYHMAQATGSLQPEWGLGAQINGRNVMHFTGTFDEMFINIADIDCTEVAIISVGESKVDGDFPALGAILSTDESDKLEARMQCDATSGKTSVSLKLDGTSFAMVSSTSVNLADDIPFILSTWYDGADGIARANGGEVSQTTDVTDGATFTINRIQCGRESNTPKNYQGEMIVLKTADINIIEKVEGYLAKKWGVS